MIADVIHMADKPILSICIPTYNRLRYLRELLGCLLPQLDDLPVGTVSLFVRSNSSTDGTNEYCRAINRSYFAFDVNERNIGGDRNIFTCCREADGEWVWLLGDDELLEPNGVRRTLDILASLNPTLLIFTEEKELRSSCYQDYRTAVASERMKPADFVLHNTLISRNVFKKSVFDFEFAERMMQSSFAHMFGIMKNLGSNPVSVASGVLIVRDVRPGFAEFPTGLCWRMARYLRYTSRHYGIKGTLGRRFRLWINLPLEFGSRVKRSLAEVIKVKGGAHE